MLLHRRRDMWGLSASPRSAIAKAAIAVALLCWVVSGFADDVQAGKRKSIVVVVAKGTKNEKSDCVGCPVSAQATGFFVDASGTTVVTSYHVIAALGDNIEPSTREIKVVVGDGSPRTAQIDYYDPTHDILVLLEQELIDKVPFFAAKAKPRDAIALADTPIYTIGVPEGYGYLTGKGVVRSFNGPSNALYLWVTDMEFKSGQSGSPVYLADGSLIGIVKGNEEKFVKNSFIVPVEYLQNLIPSKLQVGPGPILTNAAAAPTGRVRIEAEVQKLILERREVSQGFSEVNPPCAEGRTIVRKIDPSPGSTIDVASVKLNVSATPGSSAAVENITEHGFDLILRVVNAGECRRIFAHVIPTDVAAKVDGRVMYAELTKREAPTTVVLKEAEAEPGSLVQATLPWKAKFSKVLYQDFGGNVSSLMGIGENEAVKVGLDGGKVEVQVKRAELGNLE